MANSAHTTHAPTLADLLAKYHALFALLDGPDVPDAIADRQSRRLDRLVQVIKSHPIANLADLASVLWVLAHDECGGMDPALSDQPLACMWRAACALNAKP